MSDKKIKAATQEILEIVRKYDLSIFFVCAGRELFEVRQRFASWSCFEQTPIPGGSMVRFRTRKGGDGERRPERDIADSANIARGFAEEIGKAAMFHIPVWQELQKKLGAEPTRDDFLGETPPWDLK